ncbi:N-acetylmuramoyl-L-alanine amidase [Sulfurovum sp. bin170]|uniref:N-acetylmuramoyl-L-alanine amidase n=1 Tax=Sulfurovum sp. bin170 TaxID=2695268 RepID=UPI0013DE7C62|nr:peptidoglycan recognition family protein [Sulfurovum sp. bin170]NEW61228.1 N-acetylmuramoyl-L-alanine amidase [Sulfurovum sp. bin170]
MKKQLLILTTTALLTTACAKDNSIEVVYTPPPTQSTNIEIVSTPNLHNIEIEPIKIIDKPIIFKKERIDMTKEYIQKHYGFEVETIEMTPRIIVLHWTAIMTLDKSFKFLNPQKLRGRKDIVKASPLNVSAHFLIDRDGTIYRLMPDNWMARHVIGLNYSSIGVENVGGEGNKKDDLTPAQLEANIKLVRYLKEKYPTITHLIGHHEYRELEGTELWLELDKGYRTKKSDPGDRFMYAVRNEVADLNLTK